MIQTWARPVGLRWQGIVIFEARKNGELSFLAEGPDEEAVTAAVEVIITDRLNDLWLRHQGFPLQLGRPTQPQVTASRPLPERGERTRRRGRLQGSPIAADQAASVAVRPLDEERRAGSLLSASTLLGPATFVVVFGLVLPTWPTCAIAPPHVGRYPFFIGFKFARRMRRGPAFRAALMRACRFRTSSVSVVWVLCSTGAKNPGGQ
jgi:hypothetical protein